MIVLIVWFRSNAKIKRYQVQADLYAKALEKGQTVPADFFAEPVKKRNKSYALYTGIICIAASIGLSLFLWVFFNAIPGAPDGLSKLASIGIIPFLIGVAFVIIHFIGKKQAKNEKSE